MSHLRVLLAAGLMGWALSACASDAGQSGPGGVPVAEKPLAPGKADGVSAGYAVDGVPRWSLIGNALTPGSDRIDITLEVPDDVRYAHVFLDDEAGVLVKHEGGAWHVSLDVGSLDPGEHQLLFSANGRKQAFAQLTFQRSHPLYVFVSNDWDDSDNEDATLERQDRLHSEHPALKLTHFVGPYTFTDPAVSTERAEYLASWVKDKRSTHGDEIGLHIHPYCNFVNTTSVTCRTEPSFAKPYGDPSGYTVVLASYEKSEMLTLLKAADGIFEQHGLGKPTSFRAGGWSAEIHTLEALAEDGFVADASAANWWRMEEWKDVWGTSLYSWCQSHWSSIDETSQPYYPSLSDILSSAPPTVPLLELPDNGLLVDYVTAQEMIEVFDANFDGSALGQPKLVSIGYHPPNFSEAFFSRMDGALDEIDRHLAEKDEGPVVYATATELAQVWPRAE